MKRCAYALAVAATGLLLTGCTPDTTPPDQALPPPTAPAPAVRPAPQQPITTTDQVHTATGTVVEVDQEASIVVITHDPVESLGWPLMTMNFTLDDPAQMREIEAGERVEFTFVDAGGNRYVIQEISPVT